MTTQVAANQPARPNPAAEPTKEPRPSQTKKRQPRNYRRNCRTLEVENKRREEPRGKTPEPPNSIKIKHPKWESMQTLGTNLNQPNKGRGKVHRISPHATRNVAQLG